MSTRRTPFSGVRERLRRRVLFLALVATLGISVLAIFAHHLAPGLERTLAGREHLGPLCLVALRELFAPVHFGFHALLAAGLAYAGWDRIRTMRRVRGTLAPLRSASPAPGDPVWRAARAAGVDPARVRVVDALPSPAFTAGWLRPTVYVARALGGALPPEQLAAVLAHEGAHLGRRDPLRLSLLRGLALVLFWIPALRRLADDMADEAEILADDVAAGERPLALAAALLALARWSPPGALPSVVGIAARPDLLEHRVRRLLGEQPRPASRITRGSAGSAVLILGLVSLSGVVMGAPPPGASSRWHSLYCEHSATPAVTHLFCFRRAGAAHLGACPHRA